jgi:hypothetical protein
MGRRKDESIAQALLKIEAMPPRTALYFDDHFLLTNNTGLPESIVVQRSFADQQYDPYTRTQAVARTSA